MRHLAVAILLIAITTTAQTISTIYNLPDQVKTKIDEAAYHLVKNREYPLKLPLALPGFAYGKHKNIHMIVVAIPYSPDNQSGVTNLVNTMTNLLVNRKWEGFANALASIRSVYYPYETFKIKLIFIMFINTQNLLDILQDTMRDLIKNGDGKATIPYVDNILRILKENFTKWQETEEANLLTELADPQKIKINFDENKDIYIEQGGKIKMTLHVKKNSETIGDIYIYFKYESNEYTKDDTMMCDISIVFYDVLFDYSSLPPSRIQSGTTPPRFYDADIRSFLKEKLYSSLSKWLKLSVKNLTYIFPGANNELINSLTSELNSNITRYVSDVAVEVSVKHLDSYAIDSIVMNYVQIGKILNNRFTKTSVGSCSSDKVVDAFESLLRTNVEIGKETQVVKDWLISAAKDSIILKFSSALNDFENTFINDFKILDNSYNNLLNGIKDSFNDKGDEIKQEITKIVGNTFGQVVTGCIEGYLSDVAKKGIGAAVSTIPGANVVLMILNGVVGGLSKIVIINGEIYTESYVLDSTFKGITVFNTTNRAACRGDRLPVRSSFASYPDLTEAALAFLQGVASGIAKMFWSGAGGVIDMVPIVRVVDLPYPGYYFAMPAVPGIYNITISVKAQSIIDEFIKGAKEKIKNQLSNIKYKEGLAKVVNDTVYKYIDKLLGNTPNVERLVNSKIIASSTENFDKDGYLRLSVYLVSVPPYVYGGRSGDVFNYSLSYDIWGVIRANLASHAAKVNNYIQKMCSNQQSEGDSSSAGQLRPQVSLNPFDRLQGLCKDKLQELFQQILNRVLKPLDDVSVRLGTSGDIQCSLEGIVESAGKQVVAQVISATKSKIEEKLNEVVGGGICGSLVNAVRGSVENLVAKMLEDVSGVQQLANAIFTPEGSTAGGSQSGLPQEGSGDGGGGKSIRVGVCSWNSVKFAKLYALKLYNSLVDALNVPSYFLSIKPITSMAESPTQRVCYGVVNVPYFVNTAMDSKGLSDEEKKSIILDSLDIIASDETLKSLFYRFIDKKTFKSYIVSYEIRLFPPSINLHTEEVELNILYQIDGKVYYLCKPPPYVFSDIKISLFSIPSLPQDPSKKESLLKELIDRSILRDDLRSCEQMSLIIQRLTDVNGIDDLVGRLLELRSARRLVMPVATGYNVYFSAGKVYPVIRVTAQGEKNPYYFVVPFATPAREFFVLGKVGDVVVFDGGEAVVNKPFYYINVTR
ncbi:hypothetical protein ODS41_02040 [Pyrobaculum sp. 3827-6]|uniref:hypothetical protein n=1 Tax=Pyrobaculum sp. 3827-6 TaxID=2983604 RepID=UPI0021D8EBCC|nr:hypothetical protein [Pyrobaculum sp. 3827-6]MCU7786711.1 hypothetical protein [Pyrobaculum sp. 3827-6]